MEDALNGDLNTRMPGIGRAARIVSAAASCGGNAMTRPATFRTVSLPRSGNVLLLRYASAYLGLERGEPADVDPDLNTFVNEVSVLSSRSHDFHLSDPLHAADTLTVIQYREPRGHLLSYVERFEVLDPGRISGMDTHKQWRWAAMHAAYAIGFFKKWTQQPPEGALVVPYEMLAANPKETLTQVLTGVGRTPASAMIAGAVARAGTKMVVKKQLVAAVPRDLSHSAYLPPDLVDTFDTVLRRQVGWIAWPPSGPDADEGAARRFSEQVTQFQRKGDAVS